MNRLALVIAGDAGPGAARERLAALLPCLEEFVEPQVFTTGERQLPDFAGRAVLPAAALVARDFHQVLYFLEDSASDAFMVPMIRRLGGTVVLHDWALGRLAVAHSPRLGTPGLGGQLAAWREGGLSAFLTHRRRGVQSALETQPLNRSVVRHADAFIVPEAEWRRWILDERNAPTPVAVIPWRRGQERSEVEASALRFQEALVLLPTHRANRKSLIRTAIEQADQAR